MVLLNLRAWQLREPLQLNATERAITLDEVTGWSIPGQCGNYFARSGAVAAERAHRVERLGLFLHGYSGAAA